MNPIEIILHITQKYDNVRAQISIKPTLIPKGKVYIKIGSDNDS